MEYRPIFLGHKYEATLGMPYYTDEWGQTAVTDNLSSEQLLLFVFRVTILPCKAKMQYLLTYKVNIYCILALQNIII